MAHYKIEVVVHSDRTESGLEMYVMGLLMRGVEVKTVRATEIVWTPPR